MPYNIGNDVLKSAKRDTRYTPILSALGRRDLSSQQILEHAAKHEDRRARRWLRKDAAAKSAYSLLMNLYLPLSVVAVFLLAISIQGGHLKSIAVCAAVLLLPLSLALSAYTDLRAIRQARPAARGEAAD